MQLTITQSEKIANCAFLVTGGAGFIGSHIAEFLLNAGARKVRVLDNLSTGHFRNVASFANHRRFEFIKGDIRDVDVCKGACNGIDYVFHQAAFELIPGAAEDPVPGNNANVSAFLNILVAAQAAGVKRFIYAVPAIEGKDSPDAGNKFINKLYTDVFSNVYGMETIGLRYVNVYGQRHCPQSKYATIIPKLVMQLIRHESPAIGDADEYAGGLIYVDDVVQANMLAVLTTDPRAANQVYEITGEERISVHQLARCLKEYLSVFDKSIADVGIGDELIMGNHNIGTQQANGRAKELLGFQPHYSLWNGLLKSISWYWSYWPVKLEIKN